MKPKLRVVGYSLGVFCLCSANNLDSRSSFYLEGADSLPNGHLRDAIKYSQGVTSPLFPEVEKLLSLFKDSCKELLKLRKQIDGRLHNLKKDVSVQDSKHRRTLAEFNRGTSAMQHYVATRPMFIDVEVMNADTRLVLGEQSAQSSPNNVARGLPSLYKEIIDTVRKEAATITAVFPSPSEVMSILVQPLQEPEKLTRIIVQALKRTGKRACSDFNFLVAELNTSKSVYLLDNCPHDWLFPRCTAVVHHGGAGTTAAGLRAECPTTIVPFFGDQPFWGERVHARGVGPAPIPVKEFTLERLVDAIRFMLNPEVKMRAVELANSMKNEDGVVGAVNAFYKHYRPKKPDTKDESKPVASINKHFSIQGCFGCYKSSR
ncbi:sterol 3-beta-glucosyltransferase-like isoform X2 [Vicia villosa]|uniref:sterol 3-beta-glucosyltransferase-like isoform X2 n=1 Tax=Vicia villosa TaxID=3911 RepID=UPI00273CD1E5|nr:sterol 3-beta-glucosyltransferase-like isoform X2 [Vicia villosa]